MSHDSTELLPSLQVIFADKLNGVGLLENLKNGGVYSKKKVEISGIVLKHQNHTYNRKKAISRKSKTDLSKKQNQNNQEDHRQLVSFIHTKVLTGSYINTLISKCCEELSQLSENV